MEDKPLYLQDSYLREAEAKVTQVSEDKFIVLNQTIFYPNAGGQEHDTGTITKEDGPEFKIVNVTKAGNEILHELDQGGLVIGDKVKLKIDWDRRYKLMQGHSSAHIVSGVIHKETNAQITGNQITTEKIRIDFNMDKFDQEALKQYIEKANEIIERDLPITSTFLTREEAEKNPNLTILAKGLPPKVETVRMLQIGSDENPFDIQADGGTHVKSTKEIGKLEFLKAKNQGANNRRLYYVLKD